MKVCVCVCVCVCVGVCRGVTLESLCQSVHKSGFCPDSNLLNLITIYSQLAVVVSDHKPEYHVNFFIFFYCYLQGQGHREGPYNQLSQVLLYSVQRKMWVPHISIKKKNQKNLHV